MSSTVIKNIENKLKKALAPTFLQVIDESYLHINHHLSHQNKLSFNGNVKETHFHIMIVSKYFSKFSKVERHRAVYHILADELKKNIHALAIRAYSIEEYKNDFETQ